MKKFKQYYKAIMNPQTPADWRAWWDHHVGQDSPDGEVTEDNIDNLWRLAKQGYEYARINHYKLSLMSISLGNCWFFVEVGNQRVHAVTERSYKNDVDYIHRDTEKYQILREKP